MTPGALTGVKDAGHKAAPRTTVGVQGARVHNLKNISLEIPRDSLIVVTGLSGSGKSSLAFDTIYAEGQRRYMESLSSYAKRFVAQVSKPDVDFVFGLSPVISIIDGAPIDLSEDIGLDEANVRDMDAVVDRFVVGRKHEKAIKSGIAGALLVGDGLLQVHVAGGAGRKDVAAFHAGLCSATHHFGLRFTIGGKNIHEAGQLNFDELHRFLGSIKPGGRGSDAGRQVLKEIRGRLELLLGIGLDYLNLNRRSGTLSGGESQRIRLSTQIGSGLMGMLYVLDEPSIGLHPKDNVKMIATLESLRDIGNTVIVVEHDEDTIRAADHLVEMGPGPGDHGGTVVVQGTIDDVLACRRSPTGQFLSGKRTIATPATRRRGNGKALVVHGARENNLKSLEVTIPLGVLVAVALVEGLTIVRRDPQLVRYGVSIVDARK